MSEIFTHDFKAWSCDMSLEIICPQGAPELIVADIKAVLAAFEAQFSRFKADSLVSRLNRGETVPLTPELQNLIEIGTQLSDMTAGAFNPHVDLVAQGYRQSFKTQSFTAPVVSKSVLNFPAGIRFEQNEVRLKPGVVLDFGGFLKGYLSEFLAEKHSDAGQGIIVNLGGGLTVRGQDLETNTFEIAVFNPITKADITLLLENESLSTSGTYKRRWSIDGEEQHHLIDPSTNASSQTGVVSASVWGGSGAQCDAFATALFCASKDQRSKWQAQQPQLNFMTIDTNGIQHS